MVFADKGYDHASTLSIARTAAVSEGLIFKYFGNKDTLLEYTIRVGYQRVIRQNTNLAEIKAPGELIQHIIALPSVMVAQEPDFWRMQAKLQDMEVSVLHHQKFIQPVYELLSKAFGSLGYRDPAGETELLLLIIDALWKRYALEGPGNNGQLQRIINEKYPKAI